jgi:hypothetical protein
MRGLTVKSFVAVRIFVVNVDMASFVSIFFIAESRREICEGSLCHCCALPRSEEAEKLIGQSSEDTIADAQLVCCTACFCEVLGQELDSLDVGSDTVFTVESDIKKLLLKSLSSLNGVLLILILDGDPDISCCVTCQKRSLLLFVTGVEQKVLCQVVVLHPLVNKGLVRDHSAFFDLDGEKKNMAWHYSVFLYVPILCLFFFFKYYLSRLSS